jgi:class 3 adenylate cyclase
LEWEIDGWRSWYERLGEGKKLVRYDGRGSGLSDREVADYSVDAHIQDLQAVVDRLDLEKFILFGPLSAGPAAIVYAARNPGRVSKLVLWCPWVRGLKQGPLTQLFGSMIDKYYDIFTVNVSLMTFGWEIGQEVAPYVDFIRRCVGREATRAIYDALVNFDATNTLSQVQSLTLIVHRRGVWAPGVGDEEVVRGIASGMAPNASLDIQEGKSVLPWVGDMEKVLASINRFLGQRQKAAPRVARSREAVERATILFTDVEGSTALTERLGDTKAREVLRALERIVKQEVQSHSGSVVKPLGDGFMASFSLATRALECAIAIQKALAERNQTAGEPIRVRIGMNAGEPIAEANDLFGIAVNLAARIATQAAGGEILVARVVKDLAAGSKEFLFTDRGEHELGGFEAQGPVQLFEVRELSGTPGGGG